MAACHTGWLCDVQDIEYAMPVVDIKYADAMPT